MSSPQHAPIGIRLKVSLYYLVLGFVIAEVFTAAYHVGYGLRPLAAGTDEAFNLWGLIALLLFDKIISRVSSHDLNCHLKSRRIDLLLLMILGMCLCYLAGTWLNEWHRQLQQLGPGFAAWFLALCALLLFTLSWPAPSKKDTSTGMLLRDEPITSIKLDQLNIGNQAKDFADAVWEHKDGRGLIWAVDGEWGVGKSSFLELAIDHWEQQAPKPVVCRIDTLRYYKKERFIEEFVMALGDAIRAEAFVPELEQLLPAYAKQIAGSVGTPFLGLNINAMDGGDFPPEMLEKINHALIHANLYLIVVIDDLDRLDQAEVNQLLYATRCTLHLDRATYVLSLDTEMLNRNPDARQFIEKFVTTKKNLMSSQADVNAYLTGGWKKEVHSSNHGESKSMCKEENQTYLASVLSKFVENMAKLSGKPYAPLVGNLRQAKRLVNALMMPMGVTHIQSLSDFHELDLVHLTLLQLHYPKIFRDIYAQEASGDGGFFSLGRGRTGPRDPDRFESYLKELDNPSDQPAKFLIEQLFQVDTNKLQQGDMDLRSEFANTRACINSPGSRTLEKYLKYLIEFAPPDSRETFHAYQQKIEAFKNGKDIDEIFIDLVTEADQKNFWVYLTAREHQLRDEQLVQAVDKLIGAPRINFFIRNPDVGLLGNGIFLLLDILENSARLRNVVRVSQSEANTLMNIAEFILGRGNWRGEGVIQKLLQHSNAALGWGNLMAFRLWVVGGGQSRHGNYPDIAQQFSNLLFTPKELRAGVDGAAQDRVLAQTIFALFHTQFIKPRINFYTVADTITATQLQSISSPQLAAQDYAMAATPQPTEVTADVIQVREEIKTFVMYQLSATIASASDPLAVGAFPVQGTSQGDASTATELIATQMNRYVFEVCFNPEIQRDNIRHFLDHAVARFARYDILERDKFKLVVSGFDQDELLKYWEKHELTIRAYAEEHHGEHAYGQPEDNLQFGKQSSGLFDLLNRHLREPPESAPRQ